MFSCIPAHLSSAKITRKCLKAGDGPGSSQHAVTTTARWRGDSPSRRLPGNGRVDSPACRVQGRQGPGGSQRACPAEVRPRGVSEARGRVRPAYPSPDHSGGTPPRFLQVTEARLLLELNQEGGAQGAPDGREEEGSTVRTRGRCPSARWVCESREPGGQAAGVHGRGGELRIFSRKTKRPGEKAKAPA